jgi:ribosomal protein S18 acetylase RimI-like enzyme
LADFAVQVVANPIFLAFSGDVPVGCVSWTNDRNPAHTGRCWLESVYVSPSSRGLGIGFALIKTALVDAGATGKTEAFLEVGAANARAQARYRRAGFSPVSLPDRPRSSCAACEVTMRRDLPFG